MISKDYVLPCTGKTESTSSSRTREGGGMGRFYGKVVIQILIHIYIYIYIYI